mgnify:CR=1 FL=1
MKNYICINGQQVELTQEQVADILCVSRPTYINIENGKKEPTLSQAEVLAGVFRLNLEDLLDTSDGVAGFADSADAFSKFKQVLLNALKALAGIDDELHLISPTVIDPIQHLKVDHLGNRNPRLHTDETLIALSISAATNPMAEYAMEQLNKLRGCDVHSSVILSQVDERIFKRLGVNLTCEPRYMG